MSLIFLVILTSGVVAAGWWIKTEKKKGIANKKIQLKIAEGIYDPEVLKHFHDTRKKKRGIKSPAPSSNVRMLMVPTGAMLSQWVADTARLADLLLPAISKYQVADRACEVTLKEKKTLDDEVLALRVFTSSQTEDELRNWLSSIQATFVKAHEITLRAETLEKERRALLLPANRAMTNFMSNYSMLNNFDLRKAPEEFHEVAELATHLSETHKFHYAITPNPLDDFRSVGAVMTSAHHSSGTDQQIALSAIARLYDTLPSFSRLLISANVALNDRVLILKASSLIELPKPNKPSSNLVDQFVETAFNWASNYRDAEQTLLCSMHEVKRDLAAFNADLSQLRNLLNELNTAVLPIEHIPLRSTFQKVVCLFEEVVAWEGKTVRSQSLVECDTHAAPADLTEGREFADAALTLRRLLSKLANCFAQEEAAKTSYESAKGASVERLQFNAPSLSQTGAMAFVNAHTRMTEIIGKNQERAAQHRVRVENLRAQWQERLEISADALSKLLVAARNLREKYATRMKASASVSAELDRMLKVAELMERFRKG